MNTRNWYYHGSPRSDLVFLPQGSFVTREPLIAYCMGMNYNGRTWSDEDLDVPYKINPWSMPRFVAQPTGNVTIYRILIADEDLDFLDNPYEHKTKVAINIANQQTGYYL